MNIIVSRTDKIGDLVLSIPSFYMVKKMYPQSNLIVLVRNYNYDVVKNLPYVDSVLKIDDYSDKELIEEVQKLKADVFVALYTDKKVAKIARKSKAKIKIGPYSKLSSYFSYNKGIRQKRSKSIKNEAEYNLDLVREVDKKLFSELYEINTNIYYEDKNKKIILDYLNDKKIIGDFIVIHPFNGGSAKNITDLQYSELIREIRKKYTDINVIITGMKSEEKRLWKIIEDSKVTGVYAFANEGSLLDLAALIDMSKIFIGTSTGPTHIAGSLKKNVIGLYPIKATQSPKRWGVFGSDRVEYILPEGEIEEDYSVKEFLSWGKKDIEKTLEFIGKFTKK